MRIHTEFMLTDGHHNGANAPRVYAGSRDWTGSGPASGGRSHVPDHKRHCHARYLGCFHKAGDVCESHSTASTESEGFALRPVPAREGA